MPENSKTQTTSAVVQRMFEEWYLNTTLPQPFNPLIHHAALAAYLAGYYKAKEIYTHAP